MLSTFEAMKSEIDQFPHAIRSSKDACDNVWFNFARKSFALDRRISIIAVLAGEAELNFGKEMKWVTDHSDKLSKDERKLIELLDLWIGANRRQYLRVDDGTQQPTPTIDRPAQILAQIGQAVAAQGEALAVLREALAKRGQTVATENAPATVGDS